MTGNQVFVVLMLLVVSLFLTVIQGVRLYQIGAEEKNGDNILLDIMQGFITVCLIFAVLIWYTRTTTC